MDTLTDNSRTTHGVLTEPSHREGKGREGNRKGGEERGETSIHSTSSVTREAADKFWSLVNFQPGDSCWEWMGEINHRGYGRFTFRGTRTVAHRVAHNIAKGPVPDDLQCGHLCHNTRCVRPSHLRAMTAKENIRQRDERMGRVPGSALTSTERNRRFRARQRALRLAARTEALEVLR